MTLILILRDGFLESKRYVSKLETSYHHLETLSNLFLQLGRIEKHGSNLTKTFYRQAVYILS
jgi:hypothetical protein